MVGDRHQQSAVERRAAEWSGFVVHASEIFEEYGAEDYLDLPVDVQDDLNRELGSMVARFGLPPFPAHPVRTE